MGEISMTLSSEHIELEKGKGAISASVTNASTEPQQLILAAFDVAGPPAQDSGGAGASGSPGAQGGAGTSSTSWVTVENPHRSIAPGKTEQFTVAFDGTGRAAGSYTVKLIAYSADENPEDNRGESATVTVVVPAAEDQPDDGKPKIPWWVFVVAAVVLLGIGAAVFFLLGRDPEVPDVRGMPVGEAVAVLAEEDFRVAADFEYVQSDEPADTVLSQTPAAGERAESGSTVALSLAAPRTAPVPRVVGEPATVASELITTSGLTPLFVPEAPCTATQNPSRCTVSGQFPEAGSDRPLGSEVGLFTVLAEDDDDDGPRPTIVFPCQPFPDCFVIREERVLERVFPRGIDERHLNEDVFDFRADRFLQLEEQFR